MKRFPKYLLISLITFFVGLFVASICFFLKAESPQPLETETIISVETPLAEVAVETVENEDEFRAALEDIWIEDDEVFYEGYKISKECVNIEGDRNNCRLKIKNKGKISAEIDLEYGLKNWLQYGVINLLGENDKQLIVHTYSGGAHCCYDYIIYDLKPTFRVIYDSRKFEPATEIGNELVPVDIDGDGVFEFQQDVMAFDYMAPGGHATSTFPPAIFSYNKQKNRYEIANKRFPNYVLNELNKNLAGHDQWVKDNAKYGTIITQEELDEISIREKTIYLIYAGKEKEGWKFFDENYKFQFREKFKKEIKESLSKDPTYLSIYK